MTIRLLSLPGWPDGVLCGYTLRRDERGDDFNLAQHVGEDPDRVERNRQRLRSALPAGTRLAWLQQVHGTAVLEADSGATPEADALWTGEAGLACCVLTADCLPVLLCTADGTRVAAAHAGWRGLAAGVLEAAVAALNPGDQPCFAWLGPAIGPAVFEVGSEVRAAFLEGPGDGIAHCFTPSSRPGHYLADLHALARLRLERLGVRQISAIQACTYRDDEQYFSYRRDRQTGRMASFVLRRNPPETLK